MRVSTLLTLQLIAAACTFSVSANEIEAKTQEVEVNKVSRSRRVYAFSLRSVAATGDDSIPRIGKILLLKRNGEPVMAFRVLKQYPEERRFAAKRVKRYGEVQELPVGDSYTAIEKISDVTPPEPTASDRADIAELEGSGANGARRDGIKAYDPELDSGTSPTPPLNDDALDSEDETDEELGFVVEEFVPFDPYRHWLSGGIGFYSNSGAPGRAFSGLSFRYGVNVLQRALFHNKNLQDSLTVEGTVGRYETSSLGSDQDAYTVAPVIATARYNLLFGPNFGAFLYGGMMKNFVIASADPVLKTQDALGSTMPAIGGGLLFRVGPGWFARFDAGLDMIGANLCLRF